MIQLLLIIFLVLIIGPLRLSWKQMFKNFIFHLLVPIKLF